MKIGRYEGKKEGLERRAKGGKESKRVRRKEGRKGEKETVKV